MPTVMQLAGGVRKKKFRRSSSPALFKCPQKRGVIYKVTFMSPRKPNSAKRKFVKMRILGNVGGKRVFAHIPGIGWHGLSEFKICMIEGGGPKDSPGVNYSLIRGKLDFVDRESHGRRNRRSKFGAILLTYVVKVKKKEGDDTKEGEQKTANA